MIAHHPDDALLTAYAAGTADDFEPLLRESLQMGCVSFTQRYFRDGKITPARYAQAYTAASFRFAAASGRPLALPPIALDFASHTATKLM